jgi:hypothetical protein
LAYSGQARVAFEAGFNAALFGREDANPYDQEVVGKSWQAYNEGYLVGLISDTPPRGPKGETGDTGATGAAGTPGLNGTNGANGSSIYVGSGAPSVGLGSNGDQYIDSDNGDIYTKVAGTWNLQGNMTAVATTTRTDTIDPTVFPEVTRSGMESATAYSTVRRRHGDTVCRWR